MKAKASVEKKFIRVSYDLIEALARSVLAARDHRILLWFIVRTYGVRVKTGSAWHEIDAVAVSHNMISEDTGIHRSRVKESVSRLLELRILRAKAGGKVGINSKLGEWKCEVAGQDFDPARTPGAGAMGRSDLGQSVPGRIGHDLSQSVPPPLGHSGPKSDADQKAQYKERAGARARGEMSPLATERGEGAQAPRTAPSQPSGSTATATAGRLPNGKIDNMRNRAELGHPDYAPDEHHSWDRADFRDRQEFQDEWSGAQKQRENDRLAAEARAETLRIQRSIRAEEERRAALTPEERKAEDDERAEMVRKMRRGQWK